MVPAGNITDNPAYDNGILYFTIVLRIFIFYLVVQVPQIAVNTTVNPAYTTVVLSSITHIYEAVQ